MMYQFYNLTHRLQILLSDASRGRQSLVQTDAKGSATD